MQESFYRGDQTSSYSSCRAIAVSHHAILVVFFSAIGSDQPETKILAEFVLQSDMEIHVFQVEDEHIVVFAYDFLTCG